MVEKTGTPKFKINDVVLVTEGADPTFREESLGRIGVIVGLPTLHVGETPDDPIYKVDFGDGTIDHLWSDELFLIDRVTCKECGSVETLRWIATCNLKLAKSNLCFNCNHWQEKVDLMSTEVRDHLVRVDGQHYSILPESHGPFLGHGGRLFLIKFHDGRYVESTNVWFQGHIPSHFRDRLPDNAVFVPYCQGCRREQELKKNVDDMFHSKRSVCRLSKKEND